jgi:hypothetical protein
MPTKVNSLRPNPRLLIALHSPNALPQTGLLVCVPEKSRTLTAVGAEQSVLCSPVCLGIIAKYGHFLRISEEVGPTFSAVQTTWRSGKDSNPRYRSETCKSRRVRKLHGIRSFKNSLRLPASRGVVANRWGFRRSSKANPWRFCGLNWSLRGSESAWLGWRVTACLAGSHNIETFSGRKIYLRRGFLIILDFLDRTFSAVRPSPQSRFLSRNDLRFARHSPETSTSLQV